jgi:integrase
MKLVVASATDDNGDELFSRKWSHEFLDMLLVENQHQPTFTPEGMKAIAQKADGEAQVLYSLLAGTGLRIGEALGLEVKHLSPDFRTIAVEQSCWEGDLQTQDKKRLRTRRLRLTAGYTIMCLRCTIISKNLYLRRYCDLPCD